MADVTMCMNSACCLKDSCYRFQAVPGHWQSYSAFKADGDDEPCNQCWYVTASQVILLQERKKQIEDNLKFGYNNVLL